MLKQHNVSYHGSRHLKHFYRQLNAYIFQWSDLQELQKRHTSIYIEVNVYAIISAIVLGMKSL